jgi:nucleoside-diphosphate-sugar epimerase
MARALIVGCGCRGRELGGRLLEAGWAVRGTSRGEEGLTAIEAAGIEPARADPQRPGTVLAVVGVVAVVHWLLGSAQGEPEALSAIHGELLERILERLVDTPVRGFFYEAAGSVEDSLLEGGAAAVRAAEERWRIPVALVETAPGDASAWVEAALAATLELAAPAGGSI